MSQMVNKSGSAENWAADVISGGKFKARVSVYHKDGQQIVNLKNAEGLLINTWTAPKGLPFSFDAIDSMVERELEPTFKASQLPGMIVDEDGHKLSGSDDEIQAEVIAEFRETGTMSGYFFAEPLPGQSERPDESWTWGPAVSDIDWEA